MPRSLPTRRHTAAVVVGTVLAVLIPATPGHAADGDQSVQAFTLGSTAVGGSTDVQVDVVNIGSSAAVEVSVTLTVPPGLQAGEVRAEAPLTCSGLTCGGALPPGGGSALTLTVVGRTSGDHTVTAELAPRTAGADTDAANDRATTVVRVGDGGTGGGPGGGPGAADGLRVEVQPLPVVAYGEVVDLRGTLRRADGSAAGGEDVTLQVRSVGGTDWAGVTGATTAGDGSFAVRVPTSQDADLRVVTASGAESAAVPLRLVVRPAMTLDPVRIPPGGSTAARVTVGGPVAGRRLTLQRLVDGSWRDLAARDLTGPGTTALPLTRLAGGTYRLRAVVSGASSAPGREVVLPVSTAGRGDPRAYDFLYVGGNGRPARWDPCTVINYKVNARRAPAGGVADLTEAVRRVSQATGLTFRYAGTTTFVPGTRSSQQRDMFVVAWATPGETPLLNGGQAGKGGADVRYLSGGRLGLEKGMVVLDATRRLRPGFGAGGGTEGALLMHELAHAVGLDHVTSPLQVLRPVLDNRMDAAMWGAGDLAGLYRVGRSQGCNR